MSITNTGASVCRTGLLALIARKIRLRNNTAMLP
jgi:hypothetical protein